MRHPNLCLLPLFPAVFFCYTAAQQPLQFSSPDLHSDGLITFRFRAPNAREVKLDREGTQPLPMKKDEDGLWSLTIGPLEPDFYGYSFVADGVGLYDPLNPRIKPNLIYTQSILHVPGPATLPWEIGNVPHGVVHHHFYKSGVVGDERDFYVYTPPGYDSRAQRRYPVLYLLHGYSDEANAWTAIGRAHVILDNLIAAGKAKPMLVVMPLGYGAPEIVSRAGAQLRDATIRQRNMEKFRSALFTEVIPAVEKDYRVTRTRESRAIAGLSMGGAESLFSGLNAPDRFAWTGAFSSGGLSDDFNVDFPGLNGAAGAQLRLLWISCGTEDRLIAINRSLRDWLKSKNIQHTFVETSGGHTWMVWRRNLANFAPQLFH
jgi:enterochelin esterase-like enzyme